MNLCRYIIEIYNLVLSAGDDHGFQFSGKISAVETESLMSDVSFNILQFRILLQILRHKIGAKILEAELKLNDVCGTFFNYHLVNMILCMMLVVNQKLFFRFEILLLYLRKVSIGIP